MVRIFQEASALQSNGDGPRTSTAVAARFVLFAVLASDEALIAIHEILPHVLSALSCTTLVLSPKVINFHAWGVVIERWMKLFSSMSK